MTKRILIAGIGNIFFQDDAFGVHVARALVEMQLPAEVTVVDYGIRGMHLAYDLLAGFDAAILVDAISRGEEPGCVCVLDVTSARDPLRRGQPRLDPHGMDPDKVLELVATLGGTPGRVYVVGCEPQSVQEGMGLSERVAAAVSVAVAATVDVITAELADGDPTREFQRT
jgi:hydrogenase maturation protease